MRTHVDLFSGIGGFALACAANDVQTVSFCEIDERCRTFLAKAWPGVDIHDDVRTFDGLRYRDATWLLTAGVPCQPASRAGKQRGSDDDRWLWPEAIRVLSAVRPTWALFENPPGIGDVGLAGVLSDVEDQGYEVRVFSIPACAIGAPHRRERYWIVCHAMENTSGAGAWRECRTANNEGRQAVGAWGASLRQGDGQTGTDGTAATVTDDNVAHARSTGCQGPDAEPGAPRLRSEYRKSFLADTQGVGQQWTIAAGDDGRQPETSNRNRSRLANWANAVHVPCADGKFRRAPDDTIGLVDGLHRSVLGALGNSIVPAVAQRIIAAMVEAEL